MAALNVQKERIKWPQTFGVGKGVRGPVGVIASSAADSIRARRQAIQNAERSRMKRSEPAKLKSLAPCWKRLLRVESALLCVAAAKTAEINRLRECQPRILILPLPLIKLLKGQIRRILLVAGGRLELPTLGL